MPAKSLLLLSSNLDVGIPPQADLFNVKHWPKVIRSIVDVASKLVVSVSIEARRNNLGKMQAAGFF